MKYNMNNFGDNIALLRKNRGWTQTSLADRIGISPQAISKWERGIGYPDLTLIPRIAELFSVSTELLFADSKENEALRSFEKYNVSFEGCTSIQVNIGNICRVQHIYEDIEGYRISVTGDPVFLKNFKAEEINGKLVISIKNPNGSGIHWAPYDRLGFNDENLVYVFSNGQKHTLNVNDLDLCMWDGKNDQGYFVCVGRETYDDSYNWALNN